MLRAIARRLPRWILPDDLTALGVLSAIAICAAYVLSNGSSAWLWVASGLLVVHWLGDSLDGTLARVREIQRPRYGYYLDHLVDAISTALIGIGLGLSPHMLLSVARSWSSPTSCCRSTSTWRARRSAASRSATACSARPS